MVSSHKTIEKSTVAREEQFVKPSITACAFYEQDIAELQGAMLVPGRTVFRSITTPYGFRLRT